MSRGQRSGCKQLSLAVCHALQEGWLSSSGSLQAKDAGTVELAFDKFWADFGSSKLRASLSEGDVL